MRRAERRRVRSGLGQGRRYCLCRACLSVEYRGRDDEVVHRLARCKEDATASKKGAQDNGQPFERA